MTHDLRAFIAAVYKAQAQYPGLSPHEIVDALLSCVVEVARFAGISQAMVEAVLTQLWASKRSR